MYFELHGIRQQSSENKSPLKKLFYLLSCFDRKAQIRMLLLGNYSHMGLSQRNKDNVCDINSARLVPLSTLALRKNKRILIVFRICEWYVLTQ